MNTNLPKDIICLDTFLPHNVSSGIRNIFTTYLNSYTRHHSTHNHSKRAYYKVGEEIPLYLYYNIKNSRIFNTLKNAGFELDNQIMYIPPAPTYYSLGTPFFNIFKYMLGVPIKISLKGEVFYLVAKGTVMKEDGTPLIQTTITLTQDNIDFIFSKKPPTYTDSLDLNFYIKKEIFTSNFKSSDSRMHNTIMNKILPDMALEGIDMHIVDNINFWTDTYDFAGTTGDYEMINNLLNDEGAERISREVSTRLLSLGDAFNN